VRNIIPHEARLSVSGCGGIEMAQHLFLSCIIFASLWNLVWSWVGFSLADPHNVQDHFVQFVYSTSGLKARRSFFAAYLFLFAFVLWNERNNILF